MLKLNKLHIFTTTQLKNTTQLSYCYVQTFTYHAITNIIIYGIVPVTMETVLSPQGHLDFYKIVKSSKY